VAQRQGETWPTIDSSKLSWRFLRHLPDFVRLYWRLFVDQRTPFLPKLVLVAAIGYLILPFDIIPDVVPIIGEVDDVVIFLAACRLFIALCPTELVREHVQQIDAGS
jgi:uncharacterized membrane protein YkvA (DUF1232 family)